MKICLSVDGIPPLIEMLIRILIKTQIKRGNFSQTPAYSIKVYSLVSGTFTKWDIFSQSLESPT